MNASSQPFPVELPSLPSEQVRLWMEKTQDLVFLLDGVDRIAYVFQDGSFHTQDAHHWIGQSLEAVVSVESRVKIPLLLANDAAQDDSDARWRHINLTGFSQNNVPVLARYMTLPGDQAVSRALFCRDLRTLEAMNHRFLSLQQELERSHMSMRNKLTLKERQLARAQAAVSVQGMLHAIDRSTYTQAIRETVNHLERQCLHALLDDARGDPALAAKRAGLSMDEWLNKKAQLDASETESD